MVRIHLPLLFQDVGKSGQCLWKPRRVVRNHEIVGSNPTVLTQHSTNIPVWPNGKAAAC